MQTTNYDSSSTTRRDRDKVISDSFTRQKPLLGVTEQSIMNSVINGRIAYYRKNRGGLITVDPGCPCRAEATVPLTEGLPPIGPGWATAITSTNQVYSYDIIADVFGNTYITGYFRGTITINNFVSGGDGGAVTLTSYGTITSTSFQDAFIAKYNTDGIAQWATTISGIISEDIREVKVDASGNVYIFGFFSSQININSFNSVSSGVITTNLYGTLTNEGPFQNICIIKYDTNGVAQWATRVSGNWLQTGSGLAVDSIGNCYIVSSTESTAININSFSSVVGGIINITLYGTITKVGLRDIIIVKYNTNGVAQWATRIGAETSPGSADRADGIATDSSGNIYIIGSYRTNPVMIYDFVSGGGGSEVVLSPYGTLSNTSIGKLKILIVKYNSNGVAQWATDIDGAVDDFGYGITTDLSGAVYITGDFESNPISIFNFVSGGGGGAIVKSLYGTLTKTSSSDIILVKYNSNGITQWATSMTGTGDDLGSNLATDVHNNIYITGTYDSSLLNINSFLSVSSGVINVSSFGTLLNSGDYDVFLIKYDTNGNALWATRIGGTSTEIESSVATDLSGNVYLYGFFDSSSIVINTFDFISGGIIMLNVYGTLSQNTNGASFLVKYNTNGQM